MNIRKNSGLSRALLLTAVCMVASTSALASKLPEERFKAARIYIDKAQQAHADTSPSGELMLAERKLQEAAEYNDKGRDKVADRLLVQSRLHAEHAEVQGQQAQAELSVAELNAALRSLEIEIERK